MINREEMKFIRELTKIDPSIETEEQALNRIIEKREILIEDDKNCDECIGLVLIDNGRGIEKTFFTSKEEMKEFILEEHKQNGTTYRMVGNGNVFIICDMMIKDKNLKKVNIFELLSRH